MERKERNQMFGVLAIVGLAVLFANRPAPHADGAVAETAKPALTPGQNCKGYRGEARNLSGLVKQDLRNPDSFEHVETVYGPANGGIMTATMKYRATNGYGALDTFVAVGEVRADTCTARVLSAG